MSPTSLTRCVIADAGLFHGELTTEVALPDLWTLRQRLLDLDRAVGHFQQSDWQPIGALRLAFDLSITGGVRLDVRLEDWERTGAVLKFSIAADQTFLPTWIREVTRALQPFPPDPYHPAQPH